MQYTETELHKLIQTVEKEFTAYLTKSEADSTAPLAKAEDAPEKEDEKPSEKDEKPEKKDAAPAPKEDEAPPEQEASAEQPLAQDEGVEPAPEGEGHGYDAEDLEHMAKMYASMSKAELLAHHDAVRDALDALAGQEGAPADEAQPPAMAQDSDPSAMGKSEIAEENPTLNSKPKGNGKETNTEFNENSGGKQSKTAGPKGSPGAKSPASTEQGNLDDMEKSENTELELLKSELAAEKEKFNAVQEFLTKLVNVVPQGKAITSLEQVAKSEGVQENKELSKSEIDSILMKKASDPTLSKSDREAINAFYLSKSDINTISHLLK